MAGRRRTPATPRNTKRGPRLLAGGNPQIAKGYGETPIKSYLAALPGWKKAAGRKLDELITGAVPAVSKAVKYNSPMYGLDGRTWFVSFHCYDAYIKVTFFRGTELEPPPSVESRVPRVRYFHVRETDTIDAARFTSWVKQASQLPGEKL